MREKTESETESEAVRVPDPAERIVYISDRLPEFISDNK